MGAKKLLPWFDGMLEADEAHFELNGEPLFSSHMLDLSEEPHEENVSICAKYFKRMAPMKIILEMEIGITIAAAFGNVHGVYKPGNVKLQPELLDSFQQNLGPKVGYANPFFFVFHGGSGS